MFGIGEGLEEAEAGPSDEHCEEARLDVVASERI